MPAQNINLDISRIEKTTTANVQMLETMHGALSEIIRCEVSLDGGIAQRHIAETALVEVHKIARELEVSNV